MTRTVVALFDRFSAAEVAIRELENSGIERNNISIVANDAQGEYAKLAGSGVSLARLKRKPSSRSPGCKVRSTMP